MKDNFTHQTSFPWSDSHPWDVDVLVIGGGPAGLSAITRLRWIKTFNPVPLSVVLVNSGPLGGLAKLGNSILTGPSMAFPAGELVTRLKKDLATYPVPIIEQKAVAITRNQDLYVTTLEDGSHITSLSVIMACGMLDLRNIHQFWQKGVIATFGNRENILTILSRELRATRKPVLLGGPHLVKLQKTIHAHNPNTILLIDNSTQFDSPNIIYGTLKHIDQKKGEMSLKIQQGAKIRIIHTDRLILEFNSLELYRTPLPDGLHKDQAGYLQQNSTPGLFVAGDCGGPPFSAVVALGEGAKAGFQAYRYGHQYKYGKQAPLFAYYGDPSVTDDTGSPEDFPLRDELIPAHLVFSPPDSIEPDLWNMIDGKTCLRDMRITGKYDDQKILFSDITDILRARAITFCPVNDYIRRNLLNRGCL